MVKSIDGLYDLLHAESEYSSAEREVRFGSIVIILGAILVLLWLALSSLRLPYD
ncbi:MAG TPA: hypothetical protein VMS79_00895 [Methanomassiliicoccales archaeon]|jgi:hypothetical protein|nr:hypothetical protein [Methanomassiliicoccales archaeon]